MTDTFRRIVDAMTTKTERGAVRWKVLFEDITFRSNPVTDSGAAVRVGRVTDMDGEHVGYCVGVDGPDGRTHDEEVVNPRLTPDDYDRVEHLFRLARRSALGSPKLVEDLLRALEA